MTNIFNKRINIKPYEYPDLLKFKDAIRHSYWIHTEFNTTGDIQDFKTSISNEEKEILKKTMLAISQIEINVKRFWGNLYNHFPKPEIDDVGGTFAESEVRHKDAYSFVLEKLGLNEEFKKITEIPAIKDRIDYLESFMTQNKENVMYEEQQTVLTLILFSLFVEHISLFSQFLIMMSFNKEKNLFKGISNIVEATSKEERIHGDFGIALYKIIKKERPELFDDVFINKLKTLSGKAFLAEKKILDWIYEKGDLDFIPKDVVLNYMSNKFNQSFKALGIDFQYETNKDLLEKTKWFDLELEATKGNDFFVKRSINYSKRTKTITKDDLFKE